MTTFEALETDATFAELVRINLTDQSLTDTLRQIAELAKRAVPGIDESSITVIKDDRPKTMVFTSPIAVLLDERQYGSGFGPCLDAAMTGATIVLDHHDDLPLYPEFTRAALRAGILHTVAIPLQVPNRDSGALNLYAAGEEPISPDAVAFAERFASYAAYAVANADHVSDVEELARQLQEAMRSRATIEQAKGILMARHGLSADDAFRRLATISQNTNTRLRDLAARMVEGPDTAE